MGSNPKYIKSPGDYNKYTDFTFSDFWKLNKKKYKGKISWKEARAIMIKFAKLVHEEMLNNPDGIKLPSNVGTLIITGAEGHPKDYKHTTKEKRVEHRNVKTNQVVYSCGYIYGTKRGKCFSSLLWQYRSTVPLRQAIKDRVVEDNFHHWFVLKKKGDLPRYDIPIFIKNELYSKTDSKQTKKLD